MRGTLANVTVASYDVTLLLRMALATALGYAIGWEREFRGSDAGDRTFALIAFGAAAFTGAVFLAYPAVSERVIAGVATGIGFLGAGLIFRRERKGTVKGLTTSASVWAAAAVGVLAGVGDTGAAIGGALLILLVLEIEYLPGLRRFHSLSAHEDRADRSGPEPEA